MVHILYNGQPLCLRQGGAIPCEYSTRREAFDRLLKWLNGAHDAEYTIEKGPCPVGRATR